MNREFEEFRIKEEERVAEELAKALGVLYYDLTLVKPEIEALKEMPQDLARKTKSIPIKKEGNSLTIGVIDPFNEDFVNLKKTLEEKGLKINLAIISPRSFDLGLEEYKFLERKKISYTKTFDINLEVLEDVEKNVKNKDELKKLLEEIINDNPFFVLDYMLAGALKFNASDIHVEPKENEILVRYRLDGLLYDVFTFPKKIYKLIKNRIKVLGGLLINIENKPQDGSFSIKFKGENVDIRVSFIPTFEDESIVLRILIFSLIRKNLNELGLRDDDLEILERNIVQPNGLILNTGPTGSGKTTTLYAILLRLKKPELKIITIENPVEYKIEGITQTQIDERRGITFAEALRAYLRHDPDVILVGEIRDSETASVAIQASLTGHLVLSTLHTNDSLGAIPRLISLGIDPNLIPPALRLVIAQRLVRKICNYCKEEYRPEDELKEKIKKHLINLPKRVKLNINLDDFKLAKGKGCDKCFNTGYQGRIGIFELLEMNKYLESLVYKRPSEAEILETIKNDFVNLKQDALIKALNKITTIEEVERVTGSV